MAEKKQRAVQEAHERGNLELPSISDAELLWLNGGFMEWSNKVTGVYSWFMILNGNGEVTGDIMGT